jgi:hypothetical protein
VAPDSPPPVDHGSASGPSASLGTDPGTATGPGAASTPSEVEYPWTLPPTDSSLSLNDSIAYLRLARGDCDAAATQLTDEWYGFASPRSLLVFAAGVELCRGDRAKARRWFDRSEREYPDGGLRADGSPPCDMYKSVASVLTSRPRESVTCPVGPDVPFGPPGVPYRNTDNPYTEDVDESSTPAGGGG